MNSCTEWRCAKRVRKTGWYQRLIMRASESPNHSDLRLRRERNRWFVDSLLEGDGFEPSVPGESGFGFAREGPEARIQLPPTASRTNVQPGLCGP